MAIMVESPPQETGTMQTADEDSVQCGALARRSMAFHRAHCRLDYLAPA